MMLVFRLSEVAPPSLNWKLEMVCWAKEPPVEPVNPIYAAELPPIAVW